MAIVSSHEKIGIGVVAVSIQPITDEEALDNSFAE